MKRFFIIVLLALSFVACESTEAKVYRGELFMSFIDDFEHGKSEEVFELKHASGMKRIIFPGEPPKEVTEKIGQKIAIEGSENKDGDIIFEKMINE